MTEEQFESQIMTLLPKASDAAVTAWTKYGEEITTQLFNYGTQFTFNYFELRGAARKLTDGWSLDNIAQYTLENGGSATVEEHEKFAATLQEFQESEQKSLGMRME